MNVLVTGSTGFLGAALCHALVQAGHNVRAFHRPTSTLKLLEDLPGIEHALGDLTQPESILPAMQDIEIVFHCAAQLDHRRQPSGRMYAVTVEGTRAVLKAAQRAGVRRVLHTSSVAALGLPENNTPAPMNEHHSWNCRPHLWPYGYTKHLAEMEVQRAVAEGMDVVILNPSYIIGPGDIYRQSSSLLIQVAQQRLRLTTEGGLNVVHLQDVIAGHLAAMERGQRGERYILGGQNLQHTVLLQKIAQAAGVPAPNSLIPAGLLRSLSGPLSLLESFLDLPVSASLLRQAGLYFYYETRKAQVGLRLPPPRPIEDAITQALDWFARMGALSVE
ncbi:MAG: NAD-dependent epimerase/dehydratase family protein [Longilinea sp.]|nr:NAD-dependent epimerase/dehydratase family protein [Longilinea sp.]MCA1954697.1 NAD-dependent epimerase/dehydratase family protein [Anaerolinea sp.]